MNTSKTKNNKDKQGTKEENSPLLLLYMYNEILGVHTNCAETKKK